MNTRSRNYLPLVFALMSFFVIACRPEGARVKLLLPDGYVGPIRIRESTAGMKIDRNADGEYVFTIPSNGRLEVTDINPLRRISLPGNAVYSSGKLVDWESAVVINETGQIRVHSLGADSEGWVYFYIGSGEQAKAFWADPHKK